MRKNWLLVLCLAVLVLGLPGTILADDFNVFVGYSDTLRPSGFFPSPWCGDPSVTSCQVDVLDLLDAGAVRVQNTGTTPLTIGSMMVTLNGGANSFALWGPATIAPGENAIFGQTAQFNFDTSDFGFLANGVAITAAFPLGGCTNPGGLSAADALLCITNAPVVSFTENGIPVSFTDTGNILDTFGYDFVCCASDGNESINWNLVGSVANRGGAVPEPSTLVLLGTGALALFSRKRKSLGL